MRRPSPFTTTRGDDDDAPEHESAQRRQALGDFPEQPSGFGEHHNWINTGWLNICTMFYRATGKNLTLYPVHIDQKKHCFEVQKPVMFDGNRTLEEQQDELVKHLAAGLRGQHIKE